MLTTLTLLALLIVVVLCVAGLFSPHYHDTWLQHVGLIGIGGSAAMLVDLVQQARYVPPAMALMAISMAVFGLGTAYKVWRFRCRGETKQIRGRT